MSDNNTNSNGGTLTVYQRMNDPLQAVNELGTAIAKSGMFGCGSIDQGKVLALECLARGMPPLTLAERFHVVQGKLMMKYDAMLAEFHALGGKHKIISRTEEKAEIELTIDGETHRETLTWEEAKQEKWPFAKDGKTIKDNWATPKARRQMLWARAVSEGVRALRPGVNNGRYVTEEIENDDAPAASGNGQHKPATATSAQSASVVEQVAATEKPAKEIVSGPVVDAEFETAKTATSAAQPEFATDQQRLQIESLFASLGMNADQQQKALAKRSASSLRNLPVAAAAELIAVLESKLAAIRQQREPELNVTGDPNGATCGPCTTVQEQRIKAAFQEWFQIDKDKAQAALSGLSKKLHESGRAGIIQMSANDAARLYDAVQVRKLGGFFSRSLEMWKPVEKPKEETSKFVQSLAQPTTA